MRSGIIESWDLMEKFWHRSIFDYMRAEPDETVFILTEPPMVGDRLVLFNRTPLKIEKLLQKSSSKHLMQRVYIFPSKQYSHSTPAAFHLSMRHKDKQDSQAWFWIVAMVLHIAFQLPMGTLLDRASSISHWQEEIFHFSFRICFVIEVNRYLQKILRKQQEKSK